jgi:hypothetical protein
MWLRQSLLHYYIVVVGPPVTAYASNKLKSEIGRFWWHSHRLRMPRAKLCHPGLEHEGIAIYWPNDYLSFFLSLLIAGGFDKGWMIRSCMHSARFHLNCSFELQFWPPHLGVLAL